MADIIGLHLRWRLAPDGALTLGGRVIGHVEREELGQWAGTHGPIRVLAQTAAEACTCLAVAAGAGRRERRSILAMGPEEL